MFKILRDRYFLGLISKKENRSVAELVSLLCGCEVPCDVVVAVIRRVTISHIE